MEEQHYYVNHNGMTVPNGHTYEYIESVLDHAEFMTFDIIYDDGDMDTARFISKIDKTYYKFKRSFNNQEFVVSLFKIHLINESR